MSCRGDDEYYERCCNKKETSAECPRHCGETSGQDYILLEEVPCWAIPMDPPGGNHRDTPDMMQGTPPKPRRQNGYNVQMEVILSPVVDLSPITTDNRCEVQIVLSRKNKTITLQWEPFEGAIASNGVSYLSVLQTIPSLPSHPVSSPVILKYKGETKISYVHLNPNSKNQLMFYIDPQGIGSNVASTDHFMFHGGTISWIANS